MLSWERNTWAVPFGRLVEQMLSTTVTYYLLSTRRPHAVSTADACQRPACVVSS